MSRAGEIIKVKQRTGERGRPKEVEILGAKNEEGTKIVSSHTPTGETQIVDSQNPAPQITNIEIGAVPTHVTEADKIRHSERKEGDPEIRLVEADHKKWQAIKDDDTF